MSLRTTPIFNKNNKTIVGKHIMVLIIATMYCGHFDE